MFDSIIECLCGMILSKAPFMASALHSIKFVCDDSCDVPRTTGRDIRISFQSARNMLLDDENRLIYCILHILGHIVMGHIHLPGIADSEEMNIAIDLEAAHFADSIIEGIIPLAARVPIEELDSCIAGCRGIVSATKAIGSIRDPAASSFYRRILMCDDHSKWSDIREHFVISDKNLSGLISGRGRSGNGAKRRSSSTSGHDLNIKLSEGEKFSFAGALRRYASLGESPRPDPDAFHIPFYLHTQNTIGIGLIEQNEYTEERKLASFAIVIDTSGSCARGATQRFLELTRDILMKEQLFFKRFCLHIIQCDMCVRRDDVITSAAAFRRYIEELQIYGGGGTDFRPAFERINELVRTHRLNGLKGILFFSDGRGIFPAAAPSYGVTFAFPGSDHDLIDVPNWVERVIFDT